MKNFISRVLFASLISVSAVVVAADANNIARTASGKPDFTGIWQPITTAEWDLEPHSARKDAPPGLGVVVGGLIPYQPWALEQKKKNFENRATLDPRNKGFLLGVPRTAYNAAPFQILQQEKHLTIAYEFQNSVRTIYTNGSEHPHGHIDWWLGDSRGHWEGDTLVASVRHLHPDTWLDRTGNFHSEELQVIEKYTPLGPDHIRYEATLEDPKVFTRPWTISLILYRNKEKNVQLLEYYPHTFDSEKYYPLPQK